MAENKQSFVAYCEWMETFNKLTDEQAGVLIKHIFAYVNDQNPEPKDFIIDLAFTPIKQQLKRDLKKYESIVERNKINGSKGGRPKKEETQKTHSVISDNLGNPKKPKKADNDNDNDNDNEEKEYVNFTIDECLTYLNQKTGSQFKLTTQAHRKYIGGRISDGATIEQLKAVIDFKVREWSNDPKMSKYLRPATLFQPEKFDGYLAETNRTGSTGGHKYDHTRIKEHETYMDRFIRNRIDPRDDKEIAIFVEEEDKHPTTARIIKDKFVSNPEKFPYVKD